MSILLSKSSFNLNFESQEKLSLKFHFMNFVHLINTPKKIITDRSEWFNKKCNSIFEGEGLDYSYLVLWYYLYKRKYGLRSRYG